MNREMREVEKEKKMSVTFKAPITPTAIPTGDSRIA